jgi:hypothetical protein
MDSGFHRGDFDLALQFVIPMKIGIQVLHFFFLARQEGG